MIRGLCYHLWGAHPLTVNLSNFTRRSDYLLTDREAIGAISQQLPQSSSPTTTPQVMLLEPCFRHDSCGPANFLGAPPCPFESIALCSTHIGQT